MERQPTSLLERVAILSITLGCAGGAYRHTRRFNVGLEDTYAATPRRSPPRTVTGLWFGAAATIVGFLGNETVGPYGTRVGRRIGSAALVAGGLQARTDRFTGLAVLLGAVGVALGWRQADPIIGLVITVAILGVLRSDVRQVGARVMDAVDPDPVDQATAAVGSVAGIDDVHDLRASGGSDTPCAPKLTPPST